MPVRTFQRSSEIKVPAPELRDWHFRPGAFSRLNPPWEKAEVVDVPAALENGARATIKLGSAPFRIKWIAEHEITEDGFVDRQISGPFAKWEHRHRFEERGTDSQLIDEISYRLPFGFPGDFFGKWIVKRKLDRMFRYRHDVTKADLERRIGNPPPKPLTVLITGATGMIGTALTGYLRTQGHRVIGITRNPRSPHDIYWDPDNGILEIPHSLQPDAVIHLAGENVASGRWSDGKRTSILESRIKGTRLITDAVLKLAQPPSVFISASGSGYYPLDGEWHGESSPPGNHFLSDVCQKWEAESEPVREAGIRVVQTRIGAVLSPVGGALEKLLPVFKLGLGGRIGRGDQHMAWISLDDTIDILHRALHEESWEGPINLVAPEKVTNTQFTGTLAEVLKRPALIPVPARAITTIFGEMGRETILANVTVSPGKLQSLGYRFRHPELKKALSHVLGKSPD